MVFPIAGGTQDTGYEISNSLRFNQNDHCLTQTFSTSSTNRKKWTFSVWFKRSNLITSAALFTAGASGQDEMTIRLEQHKIDWQEYDADGGSMNGQLITNQVLRDVSAWYHLVCRWDSTDGTAGDRMKMFLNGVEVTSFATDNNPDQNYDSQASNTVLHNVGRQSWNNASDFDGYMADVNFVNGTALDATYFGETNDNGVWIPKKPDVSAYGANGFFLEFQQTGTSQNSSGIGADTSGNDNHFAVSNLAATDVTTDTPTNNFNTLNSIANAMGGTLSEGNTQCAGAAASDKHVFGTFGLTRGKWYWEVKVTDQGARGSIWVSDSDHEDVIGTNYAGHSFWSGGTPTSGTSNSNVGSGASDNDILCFAVDLDNGKLDISKNADIDTSGTAEITGLATSGTNRDYRISQRETGNPASTMQHNYGNAPFSISSGNSDANGYGNFEYAVPSGYFALCTKNLAEYG